MHTNKDSYLGTEGIFLLAANAFSPFQFKTGFMKKKICSELHTTSTIISFRICWHNLSKRICITVKQYVLTRAGGRRGNGT